MDAWIFVTIAAAAAQTARFMLQKVLADNTLTAAGATFARFVYSAPLVALIALSYGSVRDQALPQIPAGFWGYAIVGGLAQILATVCVVLLFAERNFAVGIAFKKTEVLLAVFASIVLLGEGVSLPGFGAILLGLVGLLLLSDPPGGSGPVLRRLMNRAAALGLLSGFLFGISAAGYRGASLSLGEGDAFLRATVTLACVTAFQTAALGAWLLARQPGEIGRVFAAWRVAGLVGITSMIGSICWFTAFTLQAVGYVKALGQIELIFSLVVTALVFRQRVAGRELVGMAVLAASIVVLVLVT